MTPKHEEADPQFDTTKKQYRHLRFLVVKETTGIKKEETTETQERTLKNLFLTANVKKIKLDDNMSSG